MIQQVHRMDIFCTTKQILEHDSHDDLKQKLRFSRKMQQQQHGHLRVKKKWRQGLGTIDVRSIMMER